jgi:exonuclease VII small subunit
MDALEPIYQRAKKLAKQAEQVLQKVAEAAKQTHSWAYAKLNKVDPAWCNG